LLSHLISHLIWAGWFQQRQLAPRIQQSAKAEPPRQAFMARGPVYLYTSKKKLSETGQEDLSNRLAPCQNVSISPGGEDMVRQYLFDPVFEIWQFKVIPGILELWESASFWKLIVLLALILFLFKALGRRTRA